MTLAMGKDQGGGEYLQMDYGFFFLPSCLYPLGLA